MAKKQPFSTFLILSKTVHTIRTKFSTVILHHIMVLGEQFHQICMTGIRASDKEKDLSRLLYRTSEYIFKIESFSKVVVEENKLSTEGRLWCNESFKLWLIVCRNWDFRSWNEKRSIIFSTPYQFEVGRPRMWVFRSLAETHILSSYWLAFVRKFRRIDWH